MSDSETPEDSPVVQVSSMHGLMLQWKSEAERYAKNADYWRRRAEAAEAEVTRIQAAMSDSPETPP